LLPLLRHAGMGGASHEEEMSMREWVEEEERWAVPDANNTNGDSAKDTLPNVRETAAGPRTVTPPVEASSSTTVNPRFRGKVLLAIRDLVFHQEVLDHLERDSRLDVVAAVTHPQALVQRIRELGPDVTVACPSTARELRHPAMVRLPSLMIVAEEMTVPLLRDAIEVGAQGVFAWPEERDELSEEIAAIRRRSSEVQPTRGRVIAVYGARGGTGTTFVASQLAATFADRGQRCVLVDLDASFADVTIALGIGEPVRTIADLVPVAEELGLDHIEDALHRHPRGFSVLLAPAEAAEEDVPPPGLYTAAITLLAGAYEVVVVHVPRGLDDAIRAAIGMADEVVLVVAPDLFSLYAARRAVQALGLDKHEGCRVLLNPSARNEIRPRDVERVLGIAPFGAVRFDSAVARAQAKGRLLPARARRAGKDLRALAARLAAAGDAGTSGRA
jgi:MinD-like ATPase involved in chromosome partitioning or flagellar assembly